MGIEESNQPDNKVELDKFDGLRQAIMDIDSWSLEEIDYDIDVSTLYLAKDINVGREFDKSFMRLAKFQVLAKQKFISGYLTNKDDKDSYVVSSINKVIKDLKDIDRDRDTLEKLIAVIQSNSYRLLTSTYAIDFVIEEKNLKSIFPGRIYPGGHFLFHIR
ncbi:MAG: hypothetical protein WC570_01890 [Patescibacteria group bacterium]